MCRIKSCGGSDMTPGAVVNYCETSSISLKLIELIQVWMWPLSSCGQWFHWYWFGHQYRLMPEWFLALFSFHFLLLFLPNPLLSFCKSIRKKFVDCTQGPCLCSASVPCNMPQAASTAPKYVFEIGVDVVVKHWKLYLFQCQMYIERDLANCTVSSGQNWHCLWALPVDFPCRAWFMEYLPFALFWQACSCSAILRHYCKRPNV